MAIGCRGRIRTGGLEVMGLASCHCSTLPYAPCGASLLCQQARKAYASSRTMGRTAGSEPTRRPTGQLGVMLCAYCPDNPPGAGVGSVNSLLRGHLTISPPASCSVWDMSPPRCCRTGKKRGCEEEECEPRFHLASSQCHNNMGPI